MRPWDAPLQAPQTPSWGRDELRQKGGPVKRERDRGALVTPIGPYGVFEREINPRSGTTMSDEALECVLTLYGDGQMQPR
jgi:hypothetical protein